VIELIPTDGNTVVIQAQMSGPIPAEVPGVAKKGQDVHIPHCYILRFDSNSKITRLDAYWDNTVLNNIKAELRVMGRPSRGGLLLSATLFVQNELNGGAKSQSPDHGLCESERGREWL